MKKINEKTRRIFEMKTMQAGFIASALCVSGAMLANGIANAEDFPRTVASQQLSVTSGFKQSSLAVLERSAAVDAETVSAALVEKVCATPCSNVSTSKVTDGLRVAGDHWSLNIKADGSAARFRDIEVEARAHSLGKDPSEKMPAATLEQAGRAFIAARLSSVIVLGPEEELVPVRTDYRTEGGQDLRTGETTHSVVANRIVFGRTLRGVPVVGGGSTVVVTFVNDGSVESFQYDWPKYDGASTQTVTDSGEILQRLQKVVGARTGVTGVAVKAPNSGEAVYPVRLTSDTVLQKLECGYYDPGVAAKNASAPVQPGCVYHAALQSPDGTRQGFAGAVPAGATFAPDAGWRESVILTQGAPPPAINVPGNSR